MRSAQTGRINTQFIPLRHQLQYLQASTLARSIRAQAGPGLKAGTMMRTDQQTLAAEKELIGGKSQTAPLMGTGIAVGTDTLMSAQEHDMVSLDVEFPALTRRQFIHATEADQRRLCLRACCHSRVLPLCLQ